MSFHPILIPNICASVEVRLINKLGKPTLGSCLIELIGEAIGQRRVSDLEAAYQWLSSYYQLVRKPAEQF